MDYKIFMIKKEGRTECFSFKKSRNQYFIRQSKYFFNNLTNCTLMNNISEARVLLEQILDFKGVA
jgi:hypothetical protein